MIEQRQQKLKLHFFGVGNIVPDNLLVWDGEWKDWFRIFYQMILETP